jgi:hypothetical protein
MEIKTYLLCLFFFTLGCKSKVEVPPTPTVKPELDFTQTKFFTIDEINLFKTGEACGKAHYWDNKPLNIQGYVFDVDVKKHSFTLYSSLDYSAKTSVRMFLRINPIDSNAVTEKLNRYLDKKCFIKTTCKSGRIIDSECLETLVPEVSSANDIDIK